MTCRLYIGVDDGHGIDAAFFRDQVSPEHALDVLTRCYPDSGAARAFVDTLGAARVPDDEDGPAADPRPDGVLVLSDVDMFLCEADALGGRRGASPPRRRLDHVRTGRPARGDGPSDGPHAR